MIRLCTAADLHADEGEDDGALVVAGELPPLLLVQPGSVERHEEVAAAAPHDDQGRGAGAAWPRPLLSLKVGGKPPPSQEVGWQPNLASWAWMPTMGGGVRQSNALAY